MAYHLQRMSLCKMSPFGSKHIKTYKIKKTTTTTGWSKNIFFKNMVLHEQKGLSLLYFCGKFSLIPHFFQAGTTWQLCPGRKVSNRWTPFTITFTFSHTDELRFLVNLNNFEPFKLQNSKLALAHATPEVCHPLPFISWPSRRCCA